MNTALTNVPRIAILVVTLSSVAAQQSQAGIPFFPDAIENAINNAGQGIHDIGHTALGNTHIPIIFKNNTNKDVWVAVRARFSPRNDIAGTGQFHIKSWYKVPSHGGTARIGNSYAQTFEFYAEGGGRVWMGDRYHKWTSHGERHSEAFRTVNMGENWRGYDSFTYSLNP